MQKPWFEKHRPTSIEEVVFESKETEERILSYISQGYVQGNMISYGPGGTGKTTINKILRDGIVKHRDDLFILKKSVKDIDDLKVWLLDKSMGSKQKIVICEEFDQLSKEAQTQLKNGLMENFMPQVAYLVTTNNINKIDPALLQRFNIKLNFSKYDVNGCFFRMKLILDKEEVQYNDQEVWQLVNMFEHKGIRELINNLQAGSINKQFKLENLKNIISTSNSEEAIANYIKYFLSYALSQESDMVYKLAINPTETDIKDHYLSAIKIMESDMGMVYESLLKILIDDNEILLPFKKIIIEYYQKINLMPYKNLGILSMLFELFAACYSIKGGDKKLIH